MTDKRLYLEPDRYWRLPDDADLDRINGSLEQAIRDGLLVLVEIEVEGVRGQLLLRGADVHQMLVIDVDVDGDGGGFGFGR